MESAESDTCSDKKNGRISKLLDWKVKMYRKDNIYRELSSKRAQMYPILKLTKDNLGKNGA